MKLLGTKTLETDRLILRKINKDDIQNIYNNWTSDKLTCRYLSWDVHESVGDTEKVVLGWIRAYYENAFNWGVELKDSHELIANITVNAMNVKHGYAEIGYCYGSKFWGNGYATEALRKVLYYLLFDCDFRIIQLSHLSGNPASGRVMQKAGMVYDATLGKRRINKNTKEVNDVVIYSITKEDWK